MSKKQGYCFAKFSLSIVIASALIIASSLGCHPTSNDTESKAATEREGIEPLQLTDANFQKEVIESVMPVFVDFVGTMVSTLHRNEAHHSPVD